MLLKAFRAEFHDAMLRFLWRQWAQLGVAGNTSFSDQWIIDPEALLVVTLRLGRFDPRLFDEVLDWCVQNGRWISVQRLKNIIRATQTTETDLMQRTVSAFATVMSAHETKPRWRVFISEVSARDSDALPFFLTLDSGALPVYGVPDPHFFENALTRPIVRLRGLSVSIPMDAPSCLLLKLRALFGLAPRAEVSAYLLSQGGAGVAEMSQATLYSSPAVRDALTELSLGGFAHGSHSGLFQIDPEQWRAFLGQNAETPKWVDWPRVFSAIGSIVETFAQVDEAEITDYLQASRMVSLNENLREVLFNAGLQNPFLPQINLDNAVETVCLRIRQFAVSLVAGETDHSRTLQRIVSR